MSHILTQDNLICMRIIMYIEGVVYDGKGLGLMTCNKGAAGKFYTPFIYGQIVPAGRYH